MLFAVVMVRVESVEFLTYWNFLTYWRESVEFRIEEWGSFWMEMQRVIFAMRCVNKTINEMWIGLRVIDCFCIIIQMRKIMILMWVYLCHRHHTQIHCIHKVVFEM